LQSSARIFMTAEYRKPRFLEKAAALSPGSAECFLWLGRAYDAARKPNPFSAPGYAPRPGKCSREQCDRSANREAVGDLATINLSAPGFLGGGANKPKRWPRK